MGEADLTSRTLGSLKPGWIFQSLDVIGQSIGLALGYNPPTINLRASWGGVGFIGMDIFSSELGMDLRIINVYGPCHSKEAFWNRFLNLSITSLENLIIEGDLNFSIGYGESWGTNAQVDMLTKTMEMLLDQHHLTDIPMIKPLPTWRNQRVGVAALARGLDRFLIKDSLIQKLSLYRQWVGFGGISDHSPIFVEISSPQKKLGAPFKFNSTWLKGPSYIQLVNDLWRLHPSSRGRTWAEGFYSNLSVLKKLSIKWAKEITKRDDNTLTEVEQSLTPLQDDQNRGLHLLMPRPS